MGQFEKGHKGYWKGKKQPEEVVLARSESFKKRYANGYINPMKGKSAWNKGLKKQSNTGRTHFKKGMTPHNKLNRTPEEIRAIKRQYRLNNKARFTVYYARKRKYRADLIAETVQRVYEDNIKQYGTLTCYICKVNIPFGKDHLEHKTPLSRGGSNEYSNLAVACQSCNCKKHNKTYEEYTKQGVR